MFTHFPIRVIQFSDTHLFAKKDNFLLGVNTYESFQAVLGDLKKRKPKPDFFVVTGDVAQEGHSKTYQQFWEAVEVLDRPVYAVAGNHDDVKIFSKMGEEHQKKLVTKGNWQILFLNTPVEGKVHGLLTEKTLADMEAILVNDLDKHLIICLHHHPVPCGSAWLDESMLVNYEIFAARVRASLRVRAVLFGHIHQVMEVKWGSIGVLSCPSTCFQFEPKSNIFTLDRVTPGFRWLDLYEDGTLKTGVIRLADYKVTVDERAKGY